MSMAELDAQFRKLPLKAFVHIRLVAGPLRSKRLKSALVCGATGISVGALL